MLNLILGFIAGFLVGQFVTVKDAEQWLKDQYNKLTNKQ